MQTTLLGLAIAFIIALVAALVGPYFIDWNQFRPQFEAEATRIVGTPVPFVASCSSAPTLVSCDASGCDVAIASDGTAYVAGQICIPGCASVSGVLRIPSSGPVTVALGRLTVGW